MIVIVIVICIFIYILITGIVCYFLHTAGDIEDDILQDIIISMAWPVMLISIPFISIGYLGYKIADIIDKKIQKTKQ